MSDLRMMGLPDDSIQAIQAIHRPSKLQETMILSTAMDPNHRLYVESYHFSTPGPIDLTRLDEVLHNLAERHSTLRVIPCWNRDSQAVDVTLAVLHAAYIRNHAHLLWEAEDIDAHEKLHRVPFQIYGAPKTPVTKWSGEMLWRVCVSPLPDSPGYRFTLSYHHALMDGTSARQLLDFIYQEIAHPGSDTETSDFMSVQRAMESWKTPEAEARLRQHHELGQTTVTPPGFSLEDGAPRNKKGLTVLARRIPTIFPSSPHTAAVPAWMGRLALALAVCAFQGTREALFFETMSARRLLEAHHRQVLGLLLISQPRLTRFKRDTSLETIAQSLRSAHDVTHNLTVGEMRSLTPSLGAGLPVAFACQTDDSYPSKGVGDWEWTDRETHIDMPLLLELMPAHQGSFLVHLHYHRSHFAPETMFFLHNFICQALCWLQEVHTDLGHYDFVDGVHHIRSRDTDLDHYMGVIANEPTKADSIFDLSEVEASIIRHPGVKACGVVKGQSSSSDVLLALVETHDIQPAEWAQTLVEIQAQISTDLPLHMIPSHFLRLVGGVAQTDSGNIDWPQLASPVASEISTSTSTSSTTGREHEDQSQLQYWASQLKDSQPAELLYDWHRPVGPTGQVLTREMSIQPSEDNTLEYFCNSCQVTPFAVMLSCFRAAHYRMTGVADANIGTFVAHPEMSANLQCLRTQVDDTDSFQDLVRNMQSTVEEASWNRDIIFDNIVATLERVPDNPLVRMAMTFHPQQADRNIDPIANFESVNLDLQFNVHQEDTSIRANVQYASDVYSSSTIDTLLSVFFELLQRGIQDSDTCITKIPLTYGHAALEDMGLLNVHHGSYPRDSSIVDIFEQEVASHPDTVAVKDASMQLTYSELDRESDHLATWLRTRNLSSEWPVAVVAPRSCEAIVAFMGILKAGLAYIPMDHRWPDSRIQTILSSITGPRLLLLGADMRSPDITLADLDMVALTQAVLQGSQITDLPATQRPSPTSLAYIMFTSGSTGQPKGVMIDHRAVVCRMCLSTHLCANGTAKPVANMGSLAFDASVWEIYTALLNGGMVVCIDSTTVLDYPALDEAIRMHSIRVAFITPALLKDLISGSPETVGRLDSLVVGGDRSDPETMFQAKKLIGCGEVVNGYGPTENTCFSTSYSMKEQECAVNGVPIGHALPESGAYVMDPQQCLVSAGILGELVVTGDGLARGYLDPQLNKDRFITVNIQGCSVRAYRTGDRVRYRPRDGQIEYFGRMDNQVKLRGQRIELAEIEHALKRQPGVDKAVVVLQQDETGNDQRLAAFITESAAETNGAVTTKDEKTHEELWKTMFGMDTYRSSINHTEIGRDFLGWKSMFDGNDIDKAQMNEWLDDTITSMRDGVDDVGHVLEIGTGSGMILFNLIDHLQTYTGLDPVESMLDFVQAAVKEARPDCHDKVHLHPGTATDIDALVLPQPPDLVIVNSVAQYFPGSEYLGRLIEGLISSLGAQTLFFGDIRSYALYSQFQVTKALHNNPDMSVDRLYELMGEIDRTETELLVDPAFFMALPEQFPAIVHHVEILPKRMHACNELSCYRYAAVVHATGPDLLAVHSIDEKDWIDVDARGITRDTLLDILQDASHSSRQLVPLANIPNRKTLLERRVVEALPQLLESHSPDWLAGLQRETECSTAFEVPDLFDIAGLTGFRVEVSWARQASQHGAFDAVFHRIPPAQGKDRTLFQFPADYHGRLAEEFSNNPMQANSSSHSSIRQALRKKLQAQLPSYMVPAVIKVLDHMPVNHNGKVDRQKLSEMKILISSDASSCPDQAPRNDVEEVICQEFSEVLACTVGTTNNFYDLGGHSLMATRAIFQIAQRLGCALSIRDLIGAPTPEALALHIASMAQDTVQLPAAHENPDIARLPALEVVGWHPAALAVGVEISDIVQVMPCSPFQEGVLSADKAFGGRSSYLATMHFNLGTTVNIAALLDAWQALVAKENMLRTVFLPVVQKNTSQGICGDAFLQAILKPDCDEIRRVSTIGDVPSPDIGIGHVPITLALSGGSRLVLRMHHALYDKAYLTSIIDSLSEAYLSWPDQKSPALNADDVPFSAFIRTLQSRDYPEVSTFWKSYLSGAPCASWPRAVSSSALDRTQRPQVKRGCWQGDARRLTRNFHTTPAAIARAAVAILIAAHGDNPDVVLGEVSSGRHHSGFVAGPCIATHPVRISLAGDFSFNDIVRTATESYARTMPYQQFGLAAIRRESDYPGELPFRVLYVYQQGSEPPSGDSSSASDTAVPFSVKLDTLGQVDFPLAIEAFCAEGTGQVHFQCSFDPTVLPPSDAHWVVQHLVQILHSMDTASGSQAPMTLCKSLIGEEERDQLLQMATDPRSPTTASPAPVQFAHDIIREHALSTPQKIALQFEQTKFVTYRELDEWSTDLSHAIRSVLLLRADEEPFRHGQPLVPISFDKSIDMVVTILAVLKAGAAFVPLDMEHPPDRLARICKTADARIIIWDGVHGDAALREISHETNCTLWTLDSLRNVDYNKQHLWSPVDSPNSLAYVLFTSGSTGTPKGVMVEHRNLVSFMHSNAGSTDCSWTSRRLALVAHTFDASVGDLFGTLGKGGQLSLVRRSQLMPQLSRWLDDLVVSHLALTPTIGGFLLNYQGPAQDLCLPYLRTLVFGGEPFRREILRHVPREMTIWNGYGPTETTIEVTASMVQGPDVSPPLDSPLFSIGSPIHQSHIYLLRPGSVDQVPIDVVGEVCIAGPQVSRGYLGDPGMTSKHFVGDPFGSTGLMYRTGDLARWHGDGSLEYLGRMDGQIKLRGLRIELGEIAAAAEMYPLVKACIVTKVHRDGSEALVALVQIDSDTTIHDAAATIQIQECIAARVPNYMVPAQVQLHTGPLPQTSSGKIDHRAVTQLAEKEYHRVMANVATNLTEITRATPDSLEAHIAKHWANVLGMAGKEDQIDITVPFSQLGGDSIRAISLLAAFRRDGIHLHMADLRQSATIQAQAAKIRDAQPGTKDHTNSFSGKESPDYLQVFVREESIATVVFVHPFLAQSKALEALVPLLDSRFNVILVDDPFFGTSVCPESLTAWAKVYLDDILPQLPNGHPLILGGYSFGGLIALEMAMLWQERNARLPPLLILLDPGTYAPMDLEATDQEQRAALSRLGVGELAMAAFQEHYNRHNQVLSRTRPPPEYHGRCLYVALPERVVDGVGDFWKRQCPALTIHCVDCDDHYALLNEPTVVDVGQLINHHCGISVSEVSIRLQTGSACYEIPEEVVECQSRRGSITNPATAAA
ncbi:hypothetical protein FE257_008194 [Aspergillus nanangensis]|uniref:Carrier domain-containing protein n=1 Tax=Aspergillus nanangensis TaxID=2582783 RepID=A0AAD4CLP2_ASPNN|nr:hypothetical protein FE257_008194 [Aspergillus nanangensis]